MFPKATLTQHAIFSTYIHTDSDNFYSIHARMHTHTRLRALFPGLPGWAGTRKVKPIWILLKQQTVSGSGISWAICKSAPSSRQITTPAPHHSVFTGRMPFLPPNQQRQSTEGTKCLPKQSTSIDEVKVDRKPVGICLGLSPYTRMHRRTDKPQTSCLRPRQFNERLNAFVHSIDGTGGRKSFFSKSH